MNQQRGTSAPVICYLSPACPITDMPNGIVSYIAAIRQGLEQNGVSSAVFVGRQPRPEDEGVIAVPYHWTLPERIVRAIQYRTIPVPDRHAPFVRVLRQKLRAAVDQGLRVFEMEESFGLIDRIQVPGLARVARLHGPWFVNGLALGAKTDREFEVRVRREGQAIMRATAVTSPSRDVLERVREYYQAELPLAKVIPNPGPRVTTELCWSPEQADPKTILFVGRFDRHKGGDLIVRAFAQLASRDPDIQLSFAGPDRGLAEGGTTISLLDYIEKHVPLALRPRLTYLGPQGPEEIARLRRTSAVCVVASRYENFPMAVVEGLAYGCPLVGAAAGGITEMIEHDKNGLLFQPEDVDELCARISAILDDPHLARRLAEAARQTYEEQYDPVSVAAETLDLYRSLPGCAQLARKA